VSKLIVFGSTFRMHCVYGLLLRSADCEKRSACKMCSIAWM